MKQQLRISTCRASRTLFLGVLCACFLSSACADRPAVVNAADSAIEHVGLKVTAVRAETLSADVAFENLTSPTVLGEHLWLRHSYRSPFLHVVDTVTGRVIASLGRHGQGPGEFERVGSLFKRSNADTVAWAWDSNLARLTRVSLSTFAPTNTAPAVIVEIKKQLFWMVPRGKDGFVAIYPERGKYFTLLSGSGEIVGTSSPRLPGDSAIPAGAREEALNGISMCPTWDRSGFALTYPYAGRIELYDSLANLTGAIEVPYAEKEVFGLNPKSHQIELTSKRVFYLGCAFSHDHLFAVFSGKVPPRSRESETESEGRFIHVFNRDGKLVNVLRSDAIITSITVDSAGKRIFATSFYDAIVFRIRLDQAAR